MNTLVYIGGRGVPLCVKRRLELLQRRIRPRVTASVPDIALCAEKVRKVHATVPAARREVVKRLRRTIEIQHRLEPVPRPFDGRNALRRWPLQLCIARRQRRHVVNRSEEHTSELQSPMY